MREDTVKGISCKRAKRVRGEGLSEGTVFKSHELEESMTHWGRANNSVVIGHSYRRSHIFEGVMCHARKFGLVLLHGDLYGLLMDFDGF